VTKVVFFVVTGTITRSKESSKFWTIAIGEGARYYCEGS